ncbi:MAG: hypothetical protein NE327_15580 [Lentisphaeraceae bacterium]|nr:hypothetical protein [Lentisphaeraceae bacterium]
MKTFLAVLLCTSVVFGQVSQKKKDSFELLLKMSEYEDSLFEKEVSQLLNDIKGTSLEIIAQGHFSFKDGKTKDGLRYFLSIEENDPYFELMAYVFLESLINSHSIEKEHLNILARIFYETKLREKQNLETGCVIGLESVYAELVKNAPEKKASFDKWRAKKWQEFYDAEPGNWYRFPGYAFHVDKSKLNKVTEPIEEILLGFEKPNKEFSKLWKNVNSLQPRFCERIIDSEFNNIGHNELLSFLEELRLHVLAGEVEIVDKALPLLKIRVEKIIYHSQKSHELLDLNKALHGKFYYVQGVYRYLLGKEKMLKEQDAKEIMIGRKSALVSLYFAGLKGGNSKWVEKARLLYEHIAAHTQDWFGVSVRDFDFRKTNR